MIPSWTRVRLAVMAILMFGAASARAQVTCSGVAAWTDCCNCRYTEGQKVTFGGSLYHAAQSFTNTCEAGWKPSLAPSLWSLNGTCIVPLPLAPVPTGTHTRMMVPPLAPNPTGTPVPTATSAAPATPQPSSTATPLGVRVVV